MQDRVFIGAVVSALILCASACSENEEPAPSDGGLDKSSPAEASTPDSGGTSLQQQCTEACVLPQSGPCVTGDVAACVTECATVIDGLQAECAECVVGRTGWYGRECSCEGTQCCSTVFGPGVEPKPNCNELVNCDEDTWETQCMGHAVGKPGSLTCVGVCQTSISDGGVELTPAQACFNTVEALARAHERCDGVYQVAYDMWLADLECDKATGLRDMNELLALCIPSIQVADCLDVIGRTYHAACDRQFKYE